MYIYIVHSQSDCLNVSMIFKYVNCSYINYHYMNNLHILECHLYILCSSA